MTPFSKILATVLLAASASLPSVSAYAVPVAEKPIARQATDVTDIRWRRVCNRNRCRNVWVGPQRYRPTVVIRPRVVQPRIIVRPGVTYRSNYSRHDRWCMARYQSYNPVTNRYLAYDGQYKRCNSPYR